MTCLWRSVLLQFFAYLIQDNNERLIRKKEMAIWVKFRVIQVWCPSFKALFTPNLVQKGKKKIVGRNINGVQQEYQKKKKKRGVPWRGWTPCPSEQKLGNVTTGLQGDSSNWVANLTVPICAWNVVFIDSPNLLCNTCCKQYERPCSSYKVFS